MKYWLVVLIIVSLGFFSLTGWAFISLPYFPLLNEVEVTGRVVLQGRDEGNLGDITIRVLEDEATVRTLTTSADGSFAFDLKSGAYRLEIIQAGWQTQTRQIVISRDDVDLRPIKLLLTGEGTCPGAITGLEEAPQITDVTSVMAPNNSLIFDFNVEVDKPARVWVEYYPAVDSSIITKTPLTEDSNTNHELQVMRLRPDATYCYQVFATSTKGGSGEASDSFPGSFTTGPLPLGLATASFEHVSGQQTYDLTLLDFNDADFTGFIVIDKNAEIVWYYEHSAPTLVVAQDDDYHLIFGQLDRVKFLQIRPDGTLISEVIDTLEDGSVCAPSGRWHHEALLQPGEKVYFFGSEMRDVDIDGEIRKQTGDTIMVWDRNKGTVSTLASLFDLLNPRVDRTPASNKREGYYWHGCANEVTSEDWAHANSLWVGQQGNILLSMNHLSQIISISPDLRSVQWRLGGPNGDFSFPNPSDRFYRQHTAKELPNGNILLFDNGNTRPQEEGGEYSRALELELDFTTMEARKVWEYRHDPDRFAECCSSTQRLANGNTLLVFGIDHTVNICCRTFDLVEADSQGNAVSVIEISSPGKNTQYRAYALGSINGEFTE